VTNVVKLNLGWRRTEETHVKNCDHEQKKRGINEKEKAQEQTMVVPSAGPARKALVERLDLEASQHSATQVDLPAGPSTKSPYSAW
jgi:hypothetical protein